MNTQRPPTYDSSTLERSRHPERLFFTTLREQPSSFTHAYLSQTLQEEAAYWTTQATLLLAGANGLQALEQMHEVSAALKHERNALHDLATALEAHERGEWADASTAYQCALIDLHFALTDWTFALENINDDTPLDRTRGTRAEREQHQIAEPSRTSYTEMLSVSPFLFRIYRNMDRIFGLNLELTQRLVRCLSQYMAEAEAREEARAHQEREEAS